MSKKLALVTLLLFVAANVNADDISFTIKNAKRLWEYTHDDYIKQTTIKKEDIQFVKESESKTDNASLLLAINCVNPNISGKYKALYNYRCKNGSFYNFSQYTKNDPFLFIFARPEHHKMVIGYIDSYMSFLNTISKPDIGYPVDTSEKEYLAEVKAFIVDGGYPSNKQLQPTAGGGG